MRHARVISFCVLFGLALVTFTHGDKVRANVDPPEWIGGYFDDFEQGEMDAWDVVSGGWSIVTDGSGENKVLLPPVKLDFPGCR